MSKGEFRAALRQLGHDASQREVDALFGMLDTDGPQPRAHPKERMYI